MALQSSLSIDDVKHDEYDDDGHIKPTGSGVLSLVSAITKFIFFKGNNLQNSNKYLRVETFMHVGF